MFETTNSTFANFYAYLKGNRPLLTKLNNSTIEGRTNVSHINSWNSVEQIKMFITACQSFHTRVIINKITYLSGMCMPILNISFWNLSLLLHTVHLKKNIPALKAWYCVKKKKKPHQKNQTNYWITTILKMPINYVLILRSITFMDTVLTQVFKLVSNCDVTWH